MIISSSRDKFGNFGPLVAILLVCFDDGAVLFLCPFVLLDSWVEMIMPPLATLLSNSSRKSLGYVAPVLCSKLLDVFGELGIFFAAPRTLDHHWVENLLPPMQALHVSPVRKVLCNFLPVLGSILVDQFSELFVLIFVPVSFVVLWILWALVHLHHLSCLYI